MESVVSGKRNTSMEQWWNDTDEVLGGTMPQCSCVTNNYSLDSKVIFFLIFRFLIFQATRKKKYGTGRKVDLTASDV